MNFEWRFEDNGHAKLRRRSGVDAGSTRHLVMHHAAAGLL